MNILDAIQEALAPKPQSVMAPDYKSPTTADLMKSGVLRSLMSMVTSPIDMSIETYNLLNPDRVRTLSERGAKALGLAEPRPFTADQSAIDFAGAVTDASPLLAGGLFKAIKESAPSAGRMGLTNQRGAIDVGGGFKFPQDDALATAQRNAAKPVSEGGLGLPADNTPMDRARAMGFEGGWYHGTTGDIDRFSPNFRGESTGANSAKKAYFFAGDPVSPPAEMLTKAPATSESVSLLQKLGISDDEIAKLNQVSMKGHGADTASGYAALGGGREYKEATRKARAAEKARNWPEYEKWTQVAEDAEIGRANNLQELVAKYGDSRDTMLSEINNAILSKKLPQAEAVALDEKMKQLMPYGWYNSYSIPQLKALKAEIAKLSDSPTAALKSIDEFISVKAERQLAESYQHGSNVMPVMLRSNKPMTHDFAGSAYREQTYSDLIDQASRGGSDALFLRNTFDPGAGPAKLIDVAAVTDPSRIRSRFAAFDPARINENDLLAGITPFALTTGLLGLLGLPKEANAAR